MAKKKGEVVITDPMKLPRFVKNHLQERIGKLVAVGYTGKDKSSNSLWLFECDCGGKITTRFFSAVSCGCLGKKDKSYSKEFSQEYLKSLLHYSPETGKFTWTTSSKFTKYLVGKEAGNLNPSGYIEININRIRYRAHRLAWFYMTGEWPINLIDHINGNPSDNRWINLREANAFENHWNMKAFKGRKYKGVYKNSKSSTYFVSITRERKKYYGGNFKTEVEAAIAANNLMSQLDGKFAVLNRID